MKGYRVSYAVPTQPYTTRNLRTDLLKRLRLVAIHKETTLENIVNQVIEAGLAKLEKTK